MRLAYVFVTAALVACGSPSGSSSSAIPTNIKAGPTTPAPKIAWTAEADGSGLFATDGFPYVSRDGSTVIVAQRDNDGGRGYQNLRFIVKNRKDREIGEHVVLKADEYEKVEGETGDKKLIPERIAAANAWLAAQHERLDLVALPKLTIEDLDAGHGEQHSANNPANSTALKLAANKLLISKGTATLVSTAMPADWAAPSEKHCKDCEPCSNPHYLKGAAVDPDRALAVVTVGYTGNDTCWEPPDQQRVVVW